MKTVTTKYVLRRELFSNKGEFVMRQRKMPGYDQIRLYQNDIVSVIQKHIPEAKLYLFGSGVFGACIGDVKTTRRDIDIALDTGCEIDHVVLANICKDIDALKIPYYIDIIDLYGVYDTMRDYILETGVCLGT